MNKIEEWRHETMQEEDEEIKQEYKNLSKVENTHVPEVDRDYDNLYKYGFNYDKYEWVKVSIYSAIKLNQSL